MLCPPDPAIDATFLAWGIAATYTAPGGGAATACTVIRRQPDQDLGIGRTKMRGDVIEVRKSEIAAPAKDGTFTLTATAQVLTVNEQPHHAEDDHDRLVFLMAVR